MSDDKDGDGERGGDRCEEMEHSEQGLGIGSDERKGRSTGPTREQTRQSNRRSGPVRVA